MTREYELATITQVAADFWQAVGNARIFLLKGEMGAGKTTLVAALCRQKGVTEKVTSPTFSIINEYHYPAPEGDGRIFHMDLYRLKDTAEATAAGVEDALDSGAYCFVEWPERAPELFDGTALMVRIDTLGPEVRRIQVYPAGGSIAEQL